MAATKYQVLYRSFNERLRKVLLNNDEYEALLEFITKDHKINVISPHLLKESYNPPTAAEAEIMRVAAENDKIEMITFENSNENPKFGMLFAYAGATKIMHQYYVPACQGWAVDKNKIDKAPEDQVGKEIGDWSVDFPRIYDEMEGYKYVMLPKSVEKYKYKWNKNYGEPMIKFFTVTEAEWNKMYTDLVNSVPWECKPMGEFYKEQSLQTLVGGNGPMVYSVNQNAIFVSNTLSSDDIMNRITQLNVNNPGNLITSYSYSTSSGWNYVSGIRKLSIDAMLESGELIAIHGNIEATMVNNDVTTDNVDESESCSYVTTQIPDHYIPSSSAPYVIKDMYDKIKGDPWFVYSTKGSLNDALDVTRRLAQKIGIENVKLIKLVPIKDYIKIK